MALFKPDNNLFSYEVIREGENIILQINCEDYSRTPSLEDDAVLLAKTIDILSDNYCLFNGLMVRSIEEPMRGGQPSFLEQSYYGRRIFGSPDLFESELHCLVILVMSDRNQLSEITAQEAILSLDIINKKEKEGVDFLDVADGLLNLNAKYSINMDRSIKCYRLEVAYGLENVKFAVKNLTGDL